MEEVEKMKGTVKPLKDGTPQRRKPLNDGKKSCDGRFSHVKYPSKTEPLIPGNGQIFRPSRPLKDGKVSSLK